MLMSWTYSETHIDAFCVFVYLLHAIVGRVIRWIPRLVISWSRCAMLENSISGEDYTQSAEAKVQIAM